MLPSAVAKSVSKRAIELVFVLIPDVLVLMFAVFPEMSEALEDILLEFEDTVLCKDETLLELLDTVL